MTQQELYKKVFKKPDGRDLILYSRQPISDKIIATNPKHDPIQGQPHMRWHPLREEWVAYASHRQNRTFLPPKEFNPLAVTSSPDFPTELPEGNYDVAVFPNLFPSLMLEANQAPDAIVPSRPANGHCEVVVFTKDADSALWALPLERIGMLLEVWSDRYKNIQAMDDIKYIMPFENRGVEMGVTLHHPHGQIYSYPFVPPVIEKMLKSQRHHHQQYKRTLLQDLLAKEISDEKRIVFKGKSTTAFIPVCARYPYEMWVMPDRPVAFPHELSKEELDDLALTLKTVLMKYENLWKKPFPYLMLLYAAPSDGEKHPEWHFHIEFLPPLRSRDRLKFLAGTELGAGTFINDSVPEEKAAELRAVEISFTSEQEVHRERSQQ
jgi:UDPglucose--hexose-1-phosphate uridylyltransferase